MARLESLLFHRPVNTDSGIEWTSGRRSWSELRALSAELMTDFKGDRPTPLLISTNDAPSALLALLASIRSKRPALLVDPAAPKGRLRSILSHFQTVEAVQVHLTSSQAEWSTETITPSGWTGYSLPSTTAYVMFTSGSTGEPKGVAIGRSALSNKLVELMDTLDVAASDRIASLTVPFFDIFLAETLLPLAAGATTVVFGEQSRKDPSDFSRKLQLLRPTVVQATPSFWHLQLAGSGSLDLSSVTVWCGGEAISASLATKLGNRARELWNLYGPTEATIWATAARISSDLASTNVPIGMPFARTRAKIDDHGGERGELLLSGPSLALEYVDDPQSTRDLFKIQDGQRWYLTGDMCSMDSREGLHFHGRADNQIKIAGHRVEIEEIAEAIRRVPGVAHAMVAVRGEGMARRLVAYVVDPREDKHLILHAIEDVLPLYMVPRQLIFLSQIPVNSRGKFTASAHGQLAERTGRLWGEVGNAEK